ncbi:hypothetical protein GCM10027360_43300 [Amycolatopsis echigonensis]
MASAVPVPSEPNNGGTSTNNDDAGVTQLSVSRVPPPTPIDLVSERGAGGPAAVSVWTGTG